MQHAKMLKPFKVEFIANSVSEKLLDFLISSNFLIIDNTLKIKELQPNEIPMPVEVRPISKQELTKQAFSKYGFHHPNIHIKFFSYETSRYYVSDNFYYCYTRINGKLSEIKFWFVSARIGITKDESLFILLHSKELENV